MAVVKGTFLFKNGSKQEVVWVENIKKPIRDRFGNVISEMDFTKDELLEELRKAVVTWMSEGHQASFITTTNKVVCVNFSEVLSCEIEILEGSVNG